MKTIPLTQGLSAFVDDADFPAVSAHNWYASRMKRRVYASRHVRKEGGFKTTQSLHQFLLPGAKQIDHKDGNGLNCQRKNLRPATPVQNGRGFQSKAVGKYSQFRGVSWNKNRQKWAAQIQVEGKQIHLGVFVEESEAARAYDRAARHHFRDFASPNFK